MSERFRCALTRNSEPKCTDYARVTIADATGDSARACPRHAVAALDGVDGARVDWADTRGINEFERKALELAEEISARPTRPEADPATPSRESSAADPAPVAEADAPKIEPEAAI
jgi:hypothetical protein